MKVKIEYVLTNQELYILDVLAQYILKNLKYKSSSSATAKVTSVYNILAEANGLNLSSRVIRCSKDLTNIVANTKGVHQANALINACCNITGYSNSRLEGVNRLLAYIDALNTAIDYNGEFSIAVYVTRNAPTDTIKNQIKNQILSKVINGKFLYSRNSTYCANSATSKDIVTIELQDGSYLRTSLASRNLQEEEEMLSKALKNFNTTRHTHRYRI